MSIAARAVATAAGLVIIATTVSLVPSNAWWIRVWDFPRLQIAVAAAVVLGATLAFVPRGRSRGNLLAGVVRKRLGLASALPYACRRSSASTSSEVRRTQSAGTPA